MDKFEEKAQNNLKRIQEEEKMNDSNKVDSYISE